jgi:hypothetical protein
LLRRSAQGFCQFFGSFGEVKNLASIQPDAAALVTMVNFHPLLGQNRSEFSSITSWTVHLKPSPGDWFYVIDEVTEKLNHDARGMPVICQPLGTMEPFLVFVAIDREEFIHGIEYLGVI